ncbi:sugar transferase [Thermus scotoductus]|uniref:sugar transferase n=1 Tax=Thermus scotoductus TaxID=37636 RepID=UPI0020A358D9|nr:sugar transferase [Thermus scotoductus]
MPPVHRRLHINLDTTDRGLYPLFKRAWEVGLVLLLSPLALLVGFLVALAVYLDLGRPILFAQERVGLGGRVFRVYKFRTMRGEPREGAYAGEEQDRITPLGRFLRRYRLDELPQLWNVLKGEMSLVGPRPEQRVLAEAYAREIPLYPLRHTVRPGLTGWAQVHQGYAEGKEETLVKLSYDLYYIKHLSFFLDLRILLRTVFVVLSGFRAR